MSPTDRLFFLPSSVFFMTWSHNRSIYHFCSFSLHRCHVCPSPGNRVRLPLVGAFWTDCPCLQPCLQCFGALAMCCQSPRDQRNVPEWYESFFFFLSFPQGSLTAEFYDRYPGLFTHSLIPFSLSPHSLVLVPFPQHDKQD